MAPQRETYRVIWHHLPLVSVWHPACSLFRWFSHCACPKPRGDRQIVGKTQLCPAPVPQRPRVCLWKIPTSSCWPIRSRGWIFLPVGNFSSDTSWPRLILSFASLIVCSFGK